MGSRARRNLPGRHRTVFSPDAVLLVADASLRLTSLRCLKRATAWLFMLREDASMNFWALVLVVFFGVGLGLWLVSFVLEALRPVPTAPTMLRWAPDIQINALEVGGSTLRYIKAGQGPN